MIGGGIVGLAVAWQLHNSHSGREVVFLENEMDFGSRYYRPRSLCARLVPHLC